MFFGSALALAACSPPGMLNTLDGATGTGRNVERVVSGKSFGTHAQRLDVWAPANRIDKHPILIFFHGGGWVKGTRQDYGFAARAFAANGYVVVVPDYRKVPGIRFPAFVQDGADAVRWTRDNIARFGGDASRIALAGHSAGAHTVAMLTLDRRWLSAVGVDPGIVKAAVGLCGPYDFYPWTSPRSVEAFKGTADPQVTQPIRFARRDAPPMLLVTGTDDVTVRPRNAINLTRALKDAGAPVILRNYDGMDHEGIVMALSKPFRGKGPVLADSLAFLEAALAKPVTATSQPIL